MTFNFSKTNMSLETINKYLKSQGIELTSDEKKQINTIFQESDTWNAGKRSEGKDGILNSIEASTFSLKINNALPKLKAKIDSLIENLGLKFEAPKREIEAAPAVSTRVETIKTAETSSTKSEPLTHAECAKKVADSWAKTYGVSNKNGEFTAFVEKVYKVAKELNLSVPNEKRDGKYPTLEDQVVDELMGAFANESKFKANARSKDGLYHGIFQFSNIMMKELSQKGCKLKKVSMQEFEKLPRTKQLDYMLESVKICKKYYSKLGNQPISAKQIYAMWKFPAAGNPNAKIKYGKKVHIGAQVQQEKCDTIKAKQRERGEISFE